MIEEDDFLAWQEHPVTQWIFGAIEESERLAKEEFVRQAWEFGHANNNALKEIKIRCDEKRCLITNSYETWSTYYDEDG